MGNWRSNILTEFTPNVTRLTLVADPDGLLMEEGVHEGIRERGFEIIPFEDYVAFRYSYESKYRSHWDRGEPTDLVVVLKSPSGDLDNLPYDLLQMGRKLSFSLGGLFPGLSYPVVSALDHTYLDDLYEAQGNYASGQLGENATKDFILRHVFGFAPELIKRPSDLLRVLMGRHYHGTQIPAVLDKRFIQVLRQNSMFGNWPLEAIIPDRVSFFAFLQERWPIYLDSLVNVEKNSVHEDSSAMSLEFGGPTLLPYDHDDVRVYVDNLFLEGILQPVSHDNTDILADTWAICGINTSREEDRSRRVNGLLDGIEKTLPGSEVRYREWLHFAVRWAELIALGAGQETDLQKEQQVRMDTLRAKVNSVFLAWVLKRYATLTNLPPVPPVMVHHIPRSLVRSLEGKGSPRIAFLLLDGLSLDQWVSLRDVLEEQDPNFRFTENAVFAWIPTITSVSRQAVFAGKLPILGVCLGHQSIGAAFGGEIVRAGRIMHGKTSEVEHNNNELFKGVANPFTATRYHSLVIKPKTLPFYIMKIIFQLFLALFKS